MNEKSFVLLKPDVIKRQLIGKIIAEYEGHELLVSDIKMIRASEKLVKTHYDEHKDKSFFQKLVSYLTSGPLVALVIEGENCINRVRKINGETDPEEAEDDTIRGKYGMNVTENTVHASDSIESAEKEIALWLDK